LRGWQQGALDALLKITDEFIHLALVALVEQVAELMKEQRLEPECALFKARKKIQRAEVHGGDNRDVIVCKDWRIAPRVRVSTMKPAYSL
jgi:hypothetical protein